MRRRLARLMGKQRAGLERADREIVALVSRHLGGRPVASVLVVGAGRDELVAELSALAPGWSVTSAPADSATRMVDAAVRARPDVIIDRSEPRGRLKRFRTTFFQLAAGGIYIVPCGAGELGPEPGELGKHLAWGWSCPERPLRSGELRGISDNVRLAIRMHVTGRAHDRHLVLSHDLADVLLKLDEPDGNLWIERSAGPHRVLALIPAEDPPDAQVITEGPARRDPPMDRPIERETIALRDYRDVVVDVEQTVLTDRVILPDTYRHHQWRRLVNRRIVDVAPRYGVPMQPVIDELPRLEGTYLHLDNEIRGHFGHLMTEVVSRIWSWPAALEIDPEVRVLVGAARRRPDISSWEYDFYEACGIPRDRIVKIDGQVRVDRLLSGTPMFSNPNYVHPRIVETWDRIGDVLAGQAEERPRGKRIFIARRIKKRACTNADEVEAIFVEHGFDIVYPEDHPLGEQIAMFRAAEVVAGYAGSGMFHIAFVPHPLHVIQIGSTAYTPRNEVLMAAIRRHRIDGVLSVSAGTSVQSSFTFDMEREGPYLRSILASL